jgi:hypothetical protein
MLARRLTTIVPALTLPEALDTTRPPCTSTPLPDSGQQHDTDAQIPVARTSPLVSSHSPSSRERCASHDYGSFEAG